MTAPLLIRCRPSAALFTLPDPRYSQVAPQRPVFPLPDTPDVEPVLSGVIKAAPVPVALCRRAGGRWLFPRYVLCPRGLTPCPNLSPGGVSNKGSYAALLTRSRQKSAHSALIFACAAACGHALVPHADRPVGLVVTATAVSTNLYGRENDAELVCQPN